jgi:hypothetical protein
MKDFPWAILSPTVLVPELLLELDPELLEYHTHPKWSAATNKSDIISAGLVCAGLVCLKTNQMAFADSPFQMYGVRIRCEEEREWVLHKLRNRAVSAVSSELAGTCEEHGIELICKR